MKGDLVAGRRADAARRRRAGGPGLAPDRRPRLRLGRDDDRPGAGARPPLPLARERVAAALHRRRGLLLARLAAEEGRGGAAARPPPVGAPGGRPREGAARAGRAGAGHLPVDPRRRRAAARRAPGGAARRRPPGAWGSSGGRPEFATLARALLRRAADAPDDEIRRRAFRAILPAEEPGDHPLDAAALPRPARPPRAPGRGPRGARRARPLRRPGPGAPRLPRRPGHRRAAARRVRPAAPRRDDAAPHRLRHRAPGLVRPRARPPLHGWRCRRTRRSRPARPRRWTGSGAASRTGSART